MNQYNYRAAIKIAVLRFIRHHNINVSYHNDDEKKELHLELHSMMWGSDEIAERDVYGLLAEWKAEENLCHNGILLKKALEEIDEQCINLGNRSAEWYDNLIRNYLLYDVIGKVIEELAKGGNQK